MEEKKQTKEDFCPICVAAVPLAFGVSTINNSNTTSEEEENDINEDDEEDKNYKKKKYNNSLIKWISIFLLLAGIISLLIILSRSK